MLSVHPEVIREAERRDPVNAYAIMYVNQHLDSLREDAVSRRMTQVTKGPGLRDRVAAAVARVRAAIGGAEADWSFLPKVQDYPYRG
jgi:hypothetical protein